MKTLLSAAILLSLSGTSFAGAELPQDIIPGYGVETSQNSQNIARNDFQSPLRAETLAYTIPGYGVTSGNYRTGSQIEIGSVEVDYLNMSFQGAH